MGTLTHTDVRLDSFGIRFMSDGDTISVQVYHEDETIFEKNYIISEALRAREDFSMVCRAVQAVIKKIEKGA